MLESENKKMEQKLKVVQDLMNKEREKRGAPPVGGMAASSPAQQDSSKMWRSSTQSSNYAKQVLESHK